jgi:hypothetical protein
MNRDERRERAAEQPPRLITGDPERPAWIAPFDGESGGTWIGVSSRGVAACVLNGYAESDEALRGKRGVPSRGSLIPRILEDQEGVGPAVLRGAIDVSAYPSFTLLVATALGGEVVRWRHGGPLERDPIGTGWTLLTSSSWHEPEVAAWRRRAFDDWRAAGERMDLGVPVLHVLAPPGLESSAPFMTREHSATRSITQVRVMPGEDAAAELRWWPRRGADPIDLSSPSSSLVLPLTPAAAGVASKAPS